MADIAQPVSEQTQAIKDALGKAILLRAAGKYEEALSHHEKTFYLVEHVPHQLRKWRAGVGRTYRLMGYPQKALDAYNEALRIPVQGEEDAEVAVGILSNIANVLIDLNRPEEAHAFLSQAEEAIKETIHEDWLGEILECRARAFYLEGKYSEGANVAERAATMLGECGNAKSAIEARLTWAACWEAGRGVWVSGADKE